jgi:hypothetical protein
VVAKLFTSLRAVQCSLVSCAIAGRANPAIDASVTIETTIRATIAIRQPRFFMLVSLPSFEFPQAL